LDTRFRCAVAVVNVDYRLYIAVNSYLLGEENFNEPNFDQNQSESLVGWFVVFFAGVIDTIYIFSI
tara:strand:- start:11 stop:208 length:198 start_codon:yes stop_codon:yes gene_type:complete